MAKTDPPGGKELGSSPPLTAVVGTGVCGLRVLLAQGGSAEKGWVGQAVSQFSRGSAGVLRVSETPTRSPSL